MKKKPKTRVAFVLDKSGSMLSTKDAALVGYNEQVSQMKILAKDQDIRCSLVTFNGEVFEHLWDVPASEMPELTDEDYKPDGSTAARDAIGYTVEKLLEDDDGDTAYLVIAITDGGTNSDAHFSPSQFAALIRPLQEGENVRWTFNYMGASERQITQLTEGTGTPIQNCAVWSNADARVTRGGFARNTARMVGYFQQRAKGKLAVTNYASDTAGMADYVKEPEDTFTTEVTLSQQLSARPAPARPAPVRKNQTGTFGQNNKWASPKAVQWRVK